MNQAQPLSFSPYGIDDSQYAHILINNTTAQCAVIDLQGSVLWLSNSARESLHELTGHYGLQHASEFVPPELLECALTRFQRVARTEQMERYVAQTHLLSKDLEEVLYYIQVFPLANCRDAHGDIIAVGQVVLPLNSILDQVDQFQEARGYTSNDESLKLPLAV